MTGVQTCALPICISHKLSCYLHEEISKIDDNWKVDCEYNRIGTEVIDNNFVTKRFRDRDFINKAKRLFNKTEILTTTKPISVFPDVNIHHRGFAEKENNLLVIEIKKENALSLNNKFVKYDFLKIEQYCKELKYQYGLFLNLNITRACCCWWINGEREFLNNQLSILYSHIDIIAG